MAIYDIPTGRFSTQNQGEIAYVKNGEVYKGITSYCVLIGSEDDLVLLDFCGPGSVAHTVAYQKVWEMGIDGTWEEMV